MVTTRAQARRAQRTLLDIPWELVLRTLDFVDQETYVCYVRPVLHDPIWSSL